MSLFNILFKLYLIAYPTNPPFTCTFDKYSLLGENECLGISYDSTNQAAFTTLDVDLLPGTTSTYVTDFTSIAGSTVSNKNCQIPFLFNNMSSYFCALDKSRFICSVDQNNNFDYCNLGKIVKI